MADIIQNLNRKKRVYLDRKERARRDYEEIAAECDREIEKINAAVKQVNSVLSPYLCPRCQGTGEESYTDAAGSRDTRECSMCGGVGIAQVVN